MNKDIPATETNASTIATKEVAQVVATTENDTDYEARSLALSEEEKKLVEDANYKVAYLKQVKKNRDSLSPEEQSEEDRLRKIAREELANSRLAEINREKDELTRKAFKEVKELKQTLMNQQKGIPTSMGTHTEGRPVSDTLVTPEQHAAFKKAGWSDQQIERYKKNLLKNTR